MTARAEPARSTGVADPSSAAFDYDALAQFDVELEGASLAGLWSRFRLHAERPAPVPIVWPWSEMAAHLGRAAELVGIGRADDPNDRRVICYVNPSLTTCGSTSETIQVNVQLVKAGEVGEAHRHTPNAMRFVIEASGDIYSTVDGEKLLMEPGDLVLTPNWTWHDHTNNSDQVATWLDVLDSPLASRCNAFFKDVWTEGPVQPIAHADGSAERRFGTVRPRTVRSGTGSVPYAYKWRDTKAIVDALASTDEMDPHEGHVVDFANPVDGGATFPTMHCRLQLIPPKSHTRPFRTTGLSFFHVVSGVGRTVVGSGERAADRRTPSASLDEVELAWGRLDCFSVPSWRWRQHVNDSDSPAYLFTISDAPLLAACGWYREQRG